MATDDSMATEEMTSSRWKIAAGLAFSLLFGALGLLLPAAHGGGEWRLRLIAAFFGLCAIALVWLLIRPRRLLLDETGFTLLGGFYRSPKKILWADIDGFFVCRLPRGGKYIGYNYKPGAPRHGPLMARMNRSFGADAGLPGAWSKSTEAMVDELNTYRTRALSARAPEAEARDFANGHS